MFRHEMESGRDYEYDYICPFCGYVNPLSIGMGVLHCHHCGKRKPTPPEPIYTQEQLDRMDKETEAILFINFGIEPVQVAKMLKRLIALGEVQKIGDNFYWIDSGEKLT